MDIKLFLAFKIHFFKHDIILAWYLLNKKNKLPKTYHLDKNSWQSIVWTDYLNTKYIDFDLTSDLRSQLLSIEDNNVEIMVHLEKLYSIILHSYRENEEKNKKEIVILILQIIKKMLRINYVPVLNVDGLYKEIRNDVRTNFYRLYSTTIHSNDICNICYNSLESVRVRCCNNYMCHKCLSNITYDRCPFCRYQLFK